MSFLLVPVDFTHILQDDFRGTAANFDWRNRKVLHQLTSVMKIVDYDILLSPSSGNKHVIPDSDEDHDNMPSMGASPYPPMAGIRVSVNWVKTLLQKLNARKAIGPDLVPTRLLKDFADDIAPILRVIFQQSLDSGQVPEDWKKANIAAVFKTGERSIAANYRPVSLTCVSCKVLEYIVFKSIMDHVDIHKILVHFQHGFRALRSCKTQLVNTVDRGGGGGGGGGGHARVDHSMVDKTGAEGSCRRGEFRGSSCEIWSIGASDVHTLHQRYQREHQLHCELGA